MFPVTVLPRLTLVGNQEIMTYWASETVPLSRVTIPERHSSRSIHNDFKHCLTCQHFVIDKQTDESAINGLLISALLYHRYWAYWSCKLHPMRTARIDGSSISSTDVIRYMKTHSNKFLAKNFDQNFLSGTKYFSLSFC